MTKQSTQGAPVEEGRFETTDPVLTPVQVEDHVEERARLAKLLDPTTPEFVRSQVQDKAEAARQLRSIDKSLASQAPKPYGAEEIDVAKKREQELLENITRGMPTQKEMRRNPAGAVDKHITWEQRNKRDILEWKNIRRRLYATGALNSATGRDISNLEQYRPRGGASELNMDNTQIQGRQYYFPNGPIDIKHGVSDEEWEKHQAEKRELMARLEALEKLVATPQTPKAEASSEPVQVKRRPGRPRKQKPIDPPEG